MSKVRKFAADVETTRTIEFVFSDETRDSYGTVFTASGWDLDRFNKNGIALFNHNSYSDNPDMAIGSARAWVEGKQLLGSITFESGDLNTLADTVFRKFLGGTYKGVSIRFNPLERGAYGVGAEAADGANSTYYIGKRELIEISVVPIPSNKNALTRSIGKETTAECKDEESWYTDGCVRGLDTDNKGGEDGASDVGETEETTENIGGGDEKDADDVEVDAKVREIYLSATCAMAGIR